MTSGAGGSDSTVDLAAVTQRVRDLVDHVTAQAKTNGPASDVDGVATRS